MNEEELYKIADEIVADFYSRINSIYDKKQRCEISILHGADFAVLRDIIYNKLRELWQH